MITNGIFADKLKISKVIPIHKTDDEKLFTNYRPISLLPSISKIFRKSYSIKHIIFPKLKIILQYTV